MKRITSLLTAGLVLGYVAAPVFSADKKDEKKPKPYPLDKCIVADEKLGSMGEPFAFVHKGQEIKLCCKGCQKDFNKNPEKYLKKLEKPAKPADKKQK